MIATLNAVRRYRKALLSLARKGNRKTRIVGNPKSGYRLAVDKSPTECVIVSGPMPTKGGVIRLSLRKASQKPACRLVPLFHDN